MNQWFDKIALLMSLFLLWHLSAMEIAIDSDLLENKTCGICQDICKKDEYFKSQYTKCGHGPYHYVCLLRWIGAYRQSKTCPVCRRDIFSDDYRYGQHKFFTKINTLKFFNMIFLDFIEPQSLCVVLDILLASMNFFLIGMMAKFGQPSLSFVLVPILFTLSRLLLVCFSYSFTNKKSILSGNSFRLRFKNGNFRSHLTIFLSVIYDKFGIFETMIEVVPKSRIPRIVRLIELFVLSSFLNFYLNWLSLLINQRGEFVAINLN
jgi:hypothetical protein